MPGRSADAEIQIQGAHTGRGPLLVLVAVEFEAAGLARRLNAPREVRLGTGDVLLQAVGLGATALPRLEAALAALRPRGVLVTGLAGGCAPDVVPGELVLGNPVGPTSRGEWLAPETDLADRGLAALRAAAVPHRVGRLVTVSEVVATPAAKAEWWRAEGAVAVDMESALVVGWAARAGLPALAIRAVADGPADLLPQAVTRAMGAAGRVRIPTVLGWAARPALLGATWRVWRRSRVALDHLARFLAALTAPAPSRP